MTPTRRALLRLEVPFGALGVALIACALWFATAGIPHWIPPAPLVRAGIPSPLTGMTRSFVALASGDVETAFGWHPLGPMVFSACLLVPVVAVASWMRDRRFERLVRVASSKTLWIGAAVLAAIAWARQLAVLG